jgi:hypothetical protein
VTLQTAQSIKSTFGGRKCQSLALRL